MQAARLHTTVYCVRQTLSAKHSDSREGWYVGRASRKQAADDAEGEELWVSAFLAKVRHCYHWHWLANITMLFVRIKWWPWWCKKKAISKVVLLFSHFLVQFLQSTLQKYEQKLLFCCDLWTSQSVFQVCDFFFFFFWLVMRQKHHQCFRHTLSSSSPTEKKGKKLVVRAQSSG